MLAVLRESQFQTPQAQRAVLALLVPGQAQQRVALEQW
jgi:hypothetical protein